MKPEQIDAAKEFVNATIAELRTERGVHAETAIAATARMAGTFLFRSFGFASAQILPGQAVLSEAANEKGPVLVQILGGVLSNQSITLRKDAMGEDPGPDHQPQQGFLETQRRLEPYYMAIRNRHQLTLQEAAEAAAVATAILITRCAGVLDPNISFNIGVYGFIEGAKTAPDPVAS